MYVSVYLLIFLTGLCWCDSSVSDEEYALMPPVFSIDDYDHCMLVKDKSLYCSFTYELRPKNESEIWRVIQKVSSDPRRYRHDVLRHYICVRESCPNALSKTGDDLRQEINKCYDQKFAVMGLNGTVNNVNCISASFAYPKSIADYFVAVIGISYVLFVIAASFYEGIARYKTVEEYDKMTTSGMGWFLSAFSLLKNWTRLTEPNNNPEVKRLRSLQGIRFYTMITVVMSHTLMGQLRGPVLNTQYTEAITKQFQNMLFLNGSFVCQSFFVVSSWLLTYHFLQMCEKHGTIKYKLVGLAILNRMLRLLPVVIVVIVIHTTWLVHMGSGPLWDEMVAMDYRFCRKNWWTNILFINNHVNPYEMCLQQTWYLAVDTQLFVLTLFLLTFAWKYKSKVKYIFGAVYVIGLAIPAYLAYINEYDIHNKQYPEKLYQVQSMKNPVFVDMFIATYSNITGWMVGVTFGYLYYYYKDVKIFTKKRDQILIWIFIFSCWLTMIFSAYWMYQDGFKATPLQSALYWSLSRPLCAFAMAMLIFGVSQGYGWFIKSILEWKAVEIFSRLSFSVYISHLIFLEYRIGLGRTPVYARDSVFIFAIFGDLCVSYIVGTVFCLLIEMPVSALQKALVPQLSQQRSSEKTDTSCKIQENNNLTKKCQ